METALPRRPQSPIQAFSGLLMLILLSLLAASWQLSGRARTQAPERISPQLRLLEWRLIWAEDNPVALARAVQTLDQESLAPWDALALGAWLQVRGQRAGAERLLARIPESSSARHHLPWARSPRQRPEAGAEQRLGGSLAGGLARGLPPEQLLAKAQRTLHALSALLAAGLALGIGFLIWLVVFDRRPRPESPPLPLSGPGLLQVLLIWFLALQASGPLASLLVTLVPPLRPLGMPLAYALHASCAALALRAALNGNPFPKFAPQFRPHALLAVWVPCFAALALLALIATGWGIGPWWPFRELPQRELGEHLARIQGLELVAFFATAALLAPLFEEFLFRGVLQPWLMAHLPMGRGRTATALFLAGVLFGAIHLEPSALPTLSTLGICFGWAAWRSGSLWVPVLLHALWNGSLVLLNRSFLVP